MPAPRHRRRRTSLWVLLGLMVPLGAAAGADADSLELAVKATYLYKFAPFIEWPDAAKGGPDDPIVLCIVGADPFGSVIDRATAGQRLGERPFVVRRPGAGGSAAGCHIAYVGAADGRQAGALLQALHGQPVLTVTDGRGPGEPKGIVNFVIVDERVRFQIDSDAATANGIAISSKLLTLAVPGPDEE